MACEADHWGLLVDRRLAAMEALINQLQGQVEIFQMAQKASRQLVDEVQVQVRNFQDEMNQKASQQQLDEVQAQAGSIQGQMRQKASQHQFDEVQAQVENIQGEMNQKASQQQFDEVQVQVENIQGEMNHKASHQQFDEVRVQVGDIQGEMNQKASQQHLDQLANVVLAAKPQWVEECKHVSTHAGKEDHLYHQWWFVPPMDGMKLSVDAVVKVSSWGHQRSGGFVKLRADNVGTTSSVKTFLCTYTYAWDVSFKIEHVAGTQDPISVSIHFAKFGPDFGPTHGFSIEKVQLAISWHPVDDHVFH